MTGHDLVFLVPIVFYVIGLAAMAYNLRAHRKLIVALREENTALRRSREAGDALIESQRTLIRQHDKYLLAMHQATGGRPLAEIERVFGALDRIEKEERH